MSQNTPLVSYAASFHLEGRYRSSRPALPDVCEHCSRGFSNSQYLTLHQRSCKQSKRDLGTLLKETKGFWENRKRRKVPETPAVNEVRAGQNPTGCTPAFGMSLLRRATAGAQPDPMREPERMDVDTHTLSSPPGAEPISVEEQEPGDLDVSIAQRKGKRKARLPSRFTQEEKLPEPFPASRDDTLPEPLWPVQEEGVGGDGEEERVLPTTQPWGTTQTLVVRSSRPNSFKVSKSYRVQPGTGRIHDPDRIWTPIDNDQVDSEEEQGRVIGKAAKNEDRRYGPFTTRSAFELAEWYWGSTQKSFADFEKLIHIFHRPDFSIPATVSVDWRTAFRALGANRDDLSEEDGSWIQDDGWKTTPISISVPFHKKTQDPGLGTYLAGNFRHRSILSVIKEKISNTEESHQFHYQPYQAAWAPDPRSPALELYGELYASRVFREVNEEIQSFPSTKENEGLERVVVSLMFWSDATRLTNFGGSTLWPCYLFFGNESKYRRCKPSELLGCQVAYFIKLSDKFKDYLKDRNKGKIPTDALFSHCARELFQCQWCVLLDDELINAMKNGIILWCPDGKLRCFYPRIFTYSADYPEKVLIAGIRNNGGCPCHRCTIKKSDLANLGAPTDTERQDRRRSEKDQRERVAQAQEVIAEGYAVDTERIEAILKPHSLVPTVNSISSRLSPLNFQLLPALVVDLLHEFEIGVWKNLFIHLIRLLDAYTNRNSITLTAELDTRYRTTPPFRRDTIRRFGANASEMKRKAARDYEDLLQCAIPAFENILPKPHNTHLMRLLYICAQWHALAKLRLHHDSTLALLDYTTVRLGAQMRLFNRETCEPTTTRELQSEADARARREGKGAVNGSASRKPAKLGVFTIKFHVLGDYSDIIRRYGTTDSYSSETGELCHRLPKTWFERTDKRNYQVQLSEIERRQARLAAIRAELTDAPHGPPPGPTIWQMTSDKFDLTSDQPERAPDGPAADPTSEAQNELPGPSSHDSPTSSALEAQGIDPADELSTSQRVEAEDEENMGPSNTLYAIGGTQKCPIDLLCFSRNVDLPYIDPYTKDTIPKLKCHLLPRILRQLGHGSAEAVNKCDWKNVVLRESCLFGHKLMRVNYTTYDVQREQDTIHVDTPQSNVMLLHLNAPGSSKLVEHPYIYARTIGIFHANVSYVGELPDGTYSYASHRIDLCWVHWYSFHKANDEFALDRVVPYPLTSPYALGFVDPANILRSVHLIPQFSLGRMDKGIPDKSKWDSKNELWNTYFINRFADRDLFMRYQYRMSVGHTYMLKEEFPPSIPIPSLPPDFDHCLNGSGAQEIQDDAGPSGDTEGGAEGHEFDYESGERPSYSDDGGMDENESRLRGSYL